MRQLDEERLREEVLRLKEELSRTRREEKVGKRKGRKKEVVDEHGGAGWVGDGDVGGAWASNDQDGQGREDEDDDDEEDDRTPTLVRQWVGEQQSRHSSSLGKGSKPASVRSGGNTGWGDEGTDSVQIVEIADARLTGGGGGNDWGGQDQGWEGGDGDGAARVADAGWGDGGANNAGGWE